MATIDLNNLSGELDKILTDYLHASFDVRQKAVQAGAEVAVSALNAETPTDTGEMAQSWTIKSKPKTYPDVRYIGNTKKVAGGGKTDIPLINVLAGKGGKYEGFHEQIIKNNQQQIFNAIKNSINNGWQ